MAMPLFVLTVGVLFSVFLTTMWNAGRLAVAEGRERWLHIAVVTLFIAVLVALGLDAPDWATRGAAALLVVATVWLGLMERGLRTAYCGVQSLFGVAVALGLPSAFI